MRSIWGWCCDGIYRSPSSTCVSVVDRIRRIPNLIKNMLNICMRHYISRHLFPTIASLYWVARVCLDFRDEFAFMIVFLWNKFRDSTLLDRYIVDLGLFTCLHWLLLTCVLRPPIAATEESDCASWDKNLNWAVLNWTPSSRTSSRKPVRPCTPHQVHALHKHYSKR